MKKIAGLILIILLLTICFYGCKDIEPFEYTGNDEDLYTEAVYSILGADGIKMGARQYENPVLEVLEEDSYGRKMFLYSEGYIMGEYPVFLLISQQTKDDEVYYYPDYNFIIREKEIVQPQYEGSDPDAYIEKNGQWWKMHFSEKQIEALKSANDWDQEIIINKCIKCSVTKRKEDPTNAKEKKNIYEEVFGKYEKDGDCCICYLTKDDDGKMIFLAKNWDEELKDYRIVIKDGESLYIQKIDNARRYQEELAAFKREHNWGIS